MDQQEIIRIRNLHKSFKDFNAVNDLSLSVYDGDVYGFLGPNGAGKSTTIRMILSLIFPTSGSIELFGKKLPEGRDEIMQHVGAIVEKPDFYGYLSAYKNLEIFGKMQGADVSKKNISKILDWVGLSERAKSNVKTFSQGMKQRLGIAQALLHNPKLIILDEPTNGLDPQGMVEIREMILRLNKEEKKTIVLSSHILSEVELIANRMVIISKGKAVVEGNVTDLLDSGQMQVTFEIENIEFALQVITESNLKSKLNTQKKSSFIFEIHKHEIPLLNKELVSKNIQVLSIVPVRSLEQYFLTLT
jgi:ABC-2 type transport system ATP-binding protein